MHIWDLADFFSYRRGVNNFQTLTKRLRRRGWFRSYVPPNHFCNSHDVAAGSDCWPVGQSNTSFQE